MDGETRNVLVFFVSIVASWLIEKVVTSLTLWHWSFTFKF
jgi:hypothetical protein